MGHCAGRVWLLLGPLVFSTTSAAAYAVNTLIGTLIIVFAVIVPPQPGLNREALASPANVPLGWSYSLSSYVQRVPIVALAFVGLFVSRYLGAFQLGTLTACGIRSSPAMAARGTAPRRSSRRVCPRRFQLPMLVWSGDLHPRHSDWHHRRSARLAHHAMAGAAVRVAHCAAGCCERWLHRYSAHIIGALCTLCSCRRRSRSC